jgi:hypothetical protein
MCLIILNKYYIHLILNFPFFWLNLFFLYFFFFTYDTSDFLAEWLDFNDLIDLLLSDLLILGTDFLDWDLPLSLLESVLF